MWITANDANLKFKTGCSFANGIGYTYIIIRNGNTNFDYQELTKQLDKMRWLFVKAELTDYLISRCSIFYKN